MATHHQHVCMMFLHYLTKNIPRISFHHFIFNISHLQLNTYSKKHKNQTVKTPNIITQKAQNTLIMINIVENQKKKKRR